jgi:integrase/recombinase XerD
MIIWRRHTAPCQSTDRCDARCGCPIYEEFRVSKKRFRRTLKTRNWQKALADARRKEIEGTQAKRESPTIEQACERYIQDAKARELREPTLYKFRLLFRQLQEFSTAQGLVFVSDFTIDDVRRFRASWINKNFAARKKLESLRAFFKFCNVSGWISTNPVLALKPGKVTDPQIVPITKEEFEEILKACEIYPEKETCKRFKVFAIRLTALVLVMRYTGLRIRDVVTLRKDHIRNGKVFLRTAKTGTKVFCPLPKTVLDALNAIGAKSDYYFWSGESKPKSAVGNYQRALRVLFDLAQLPRVHAHLLRHTFATELLTAGNSIETVAALLGNSPKIVEKHYHHWVKGRQEKLEEAVRNSWAQLGTVEAAQS